MKVNPLYDAFRALAGSQNREDADGRQHGSARREKDKDSEEKAPVEAAPEAPVEVTDEKVQAALQAFSVDADTRANGLTVEPEGKGPGLRILLKDARGQVLRKLSGEEFLRLREKATGTGQHPRGRLLDRKL